METEPAGVCAGHPPGLGAQHPSCGNVIGVERKSEARVRYSPSEEGEALPSSPFTKQSERGVPKARCGAPRGLRTRSPRGLSTAGGGRMALANSCVISLFCLPINSQSLQLHDSPLPSSESPSGGSKDLSSPLRNRTEQGNFFFLFFFFFSEQHCEYIQHIGVYRKCKWFCYTNNGRGKLMWN